MPWIAAGYALRATATVLERVCYGHARTRSVLMIQTATALTAIAAVPLATGTWGLQGSAAAVAGVFAVQLSVAAAFAYHSRTGLDGTGPGTMAA
jgi:Na+-driven multidrug efflux pump